MRLDIDSDLNLNRSLQTNLVLDGMNPYHVMTLTRHKSVQSFRRYTQAADRQAAEAAFYETKRRKRKMADEMEP
ncbi:MAG: hypothetical protein CLLPBCKN_007672 [Chroococcidiopsis cubana SAG 39.79]|uniref:Tyr recombinase domain-containing protein n=2 Tax=Chroococcidiopsis TaxID=54298 RepID=A0AB37UTC6_9CYAN|nr:hypothetical protein [Chroococcidiopsis cubana SAG 39.79]RUT14507.1 hypothetical protein DSM107010_00530 [Chroococcidiopsis cubana SAG 39.79]